MKKRGRSAKFPGRHGFFTGMPERPPGFDKILKEQAAEEEAEGRKFRDKNGNPVKVTDKMFDA